MNTAASTETAIDLTKYGNFLKCLKIIAWMKRFVAKVEKLISENSSLSARKLDEAEHYFIFFLFYILFFGFIPSRK